MAQHFKSLVAATVLVLQTCFWICFATESDYSCTEACICCETGICNEDGNCSGCKNGYTGSNCMEPCHTNCKKCSQTFLISRECLLCNDGYYIGQYRDLDTRPVQKDCSLTCKQGCKICESYSKCTECLVGHFLDTKNDCRKCPAHCKMCSSEKECRRCNERYFWDGFACRQCRSPCKICKSLTECEACPDGYLLWNGGCLECVLPCKSCEVTAQLKQVCNECAEGYYTDGHACLKCGEHCTNCSFHNLCTTCEEKYFNAHGKCIMYPKSCLHGLAEKLFKANFSSFLLANNLVCTDKIDICEYMYKIDDCKADSTYCLQDMCKLIADECQVDTVCEYTTTRNNHGVSNITNGDHQQKIRILIVVCSTLFTAVLVLLSYILWKKCPDMKKTVRKGNDRENDQKESDMHLNATERKPLIEAKQNEGNSVDNDTTQTLDRSSLTSADDQQEVKHKKRGSGKENEKATTFMFETTASRSLKLKSQPVTAKPNSPMEKQGISTDKTHTSPELDAKGVQRPEMLVTSKMATRQFEDRIIVEAMEESFHEPTLLCSHCGKIYTKQESLNRHMRSHDRTEKHVCPEYGKRFIQKSVLVAHLTKHGGQKVSCEQCGQQYAHKQSHNRHQRQGCKTKLPKVFQCSHYGAEFKRKCILRDHEKAKRMKEYRYECVICKKTFKWRSSLKAHKDQKHKS